MYIAIIAEQPSNRLLWQYRVKQFQESLHYEIEILSNQEATGRSDVEAWLVVLDQGTEEEVLQRIKAHEDLASHVVFILPQNLMVSEEWLEAILDERSVYCFLEKNYDKEAFFQMVFKPQTASKAVIDEEQQTENLETVWIESQKQEVVKVQGFKKLFRGFTNNSMQAGGKVLPRLKLCVFGEAATAYELAAVLSSHFNQQVLLMDIDRLMPSADLYTGVNSTVKVQYDFFAQATATGLNILLDCLKKGELHREAYQRATQSPKGFKNLHVLTGVYQLADYEYYRSDDLVKLMDKAAAYYDVILLRSNGYPYDGYALQAFGEADYILAGLRYEIDVVRAYRQMTQLLCEKQGIKMEKHGWVGFEGRDKNPLEKQFFESIAGVKQLGNISFLQQREQGKSTGKFYLKPAEIQLSKIYVPIIEALYRSVI